MNDILLIDVKVRNAFYFLKTNKNPGYDDLSMQVMMLLTL